jgi:hypothetical protein
MTVGLNGGSAAICKPPALNEKTTRKANKSFAVTQNLGADRYRVQGTKLQPPGVESLDAFS